MRVAHDGGDDVALVTIRVMLDDGTWLDCPVDLTLNDGDNVELECGKYTGEVVKKADAVEERPRIPIV